MSKWVFIQLMTHSTSWDLLTWNPYNNYWTVVLYQKKIQQLSTFAISLASWTTTINKLINNYDCIISGKWYIHNSSHMWQTLWKNQTHYAHINHTCLGLPQPLYRTRRGWATIMENVTFVLHLLFHVMITKWINCSKKALHIMHVYGWQYTQQATLHSSLELVVHRLSTYSGNTVSRLQN